ncbi:hypothetical protein [Microcoleus sp. FACHB-672]|uniref:hypothetical protein n=1 Tax=Microcoleus sp. FACHB-672 TaxID=2692825 RepID=UPI001687221E|nr:hypothetical protein [Microcoleus sp. FACHB-672]MBD2040187.1 hypothetical protein [Microcoleus sp. FACHB-672]
MSKAIMAKQRGEDGLFTQIGHEQRNVRSLRLTNTTWETLGQIAEAKEATRADVIEEFAATYYTVSEDNHPGNTRQLEQEVEDLREDKELLKDAICTVAALQPEIPIQTATERCEALQSDLPDAGTLLNQLKGKHPKSKASLKDVETILGLLEF